MQDHIKSVTSADIESHQYRSVINCLVVAISQCPIQSWKCSDTLYVLCIRTTTVWTGSVQPYTFPSQTVSFLQTLLAGEWRPFRVPVNVQFERSVFTAFINGSDKFCSWATNKERSPSSAFSAPWWWLDLYKESAILLLVSNFYTVTNLCKSEKSIHLAKWPWISFFQNAY